MTASSSELHIEDKKWLKICNDTDDEAECPKCGLIIMVKLKISGFVVTCGWILICNNNIPEELYCYKCQHS